MALQKTQMGYFSCALDGHQCRFRDKAPLSLCQSLCLHNSSRLGAVGAATRKLANRLSNSCMLQVMHWAHSTAVQENLHLAASAEEVKERRAELDAQTLSYKGLFFRSWCV